MSKTTPLEEVLLPVTLDVELDVAAAIEVLSDAAANAAVPALSLLEPCLAHSDPALRAAALRALASAHSLQALRVLMAGLNDRHNDVVQAAAEAALHCQEEGPGILVAFDPHATARRTAARRTSRLELLYLLLADPESRAEVIERLQSHRPIGGAEPHRTIVSTLIATGMLPPADAASLYRADAPTAGLLALQMIKEALTATEAEGVGPSIIRNVPRGLDELTGRRGMPALFSTIIEWLDATPRAWRAVLRKRTEVLDPNREPDQLAELMWLSLTVYAARFHAQRNHWNADALVVESTTMPWLLLSPQIPLEVRREALREAAGTTEHSELRASSGWVEPFVTKCLMDPVTHTSSGAVDLRATYALLEVQADGQPLRTMETRLGKMPIVLAAHDGAADLAWIIGKSKWRGSDHLIAVPWLEMLAWQDEPAFIEVTRSLPLRYWKEVPLGASNRQLESLLETLAASDAPSQIWSAWASAITGTGPSVNAVLEAAGYRAVRPSSALFPSALSAVQEAEAKRLGVPAIVEHVLTGIVLVLSPGGAFLMGAPDDDPEAYPRERPVRLVTVDTHYLAVTPVTQGQWMRALPDSVLSFRDGPTVPARGLNWKSAVDFLKTLNCGMRLPREAEWEHAARAGSASRYWWGDAFQPGMANCQGELPTASVTPSGSYPANAWGLVDILGNVWEWCQEWFTDPMFPSRDRWRTLRGGSWFHERWNARVTERFWGEPEGTDATGIWGFRPAADLAICFGKE